MRRSLYNEDFELTLDDLQETIDSKTDEVVRRVADIAFSPGVISGLVVASAGEFSLSVSAGTAYDVHGERIVIGSETVAFGASDAGKSVVARFLSSDDTLSAHPVTGTLNPDRTIDSYELAVVAQPTADDVILATLDSIDETTNIATLGTATRQTWGGRFGLGAFDEATLLQSDTIYSHINALGTGASVTTANPHRQSPKDVGFSPDTTQAVHQAVDHGPHLQTADPNSLSGLLSVSGDDIDTTPIVSGEAFIVNGTRVTTVTNPSLTVDFTPLKPGLFAVLMDDSGTIYTKSLLLYVNAARVVTGVTPVDVDPDYLITSPVKTLDYVVAGSVKTLSWGGGPAVTIQNAGDGFNGDRFYFLRDGDEAGGILVWVDYSALNVASQSEDITLEDVPETNGSVVLGNIPHMINDASPMGYGDDGTYGRVYDTRDFGNLSFLHLADELKDKIRRVHYDLRGDGWSEGGEEGASPGGFDFIVEAGVVYVGGKRFQLPTSTVALPAPNTTYFIYVNDTGTLTYSAVDPALTNVNSPIRYARAYTVTTGAVSGFVFTRNDRRSLPQTDDWVRLGVESLYSAIAQQIPRLKIDQGQFGTDRNKHRGRTLLLESDGPGGFHKLRVYLTNWSFNPFLNPLNGISKVSGIEIAVNAIWQPDYLGFDTLNLWSVDNTANDAVLYGFDGFGCYFSVKRKEDFTGLVPLWSDTGIEGVSWTSFPLQIDHQTSMAFMRTTPKLVNGLVTGLENEAPVIAYTNTQHPKNLIKAWGFFDVYHKVDADENLIAVPRVIAGMNVGDPEYIGDKTNNLWRIPLGTRILRLVDDRLGVIPDGAVVAIDQQEPSPSPVTRFRIYLFDDGKKTYVIVQGPINPAPTVGQTAEGSFSINFMVVGAQTFEVPSNIQIGNVDFSGVFGQTAPGFGNVLQGLSFGPFVPMSGSLDDPRDLDAQAHRGTLEGNKLTSDVIGSGIKAR